MESQLIAATVYFDRGKIKPLVIFVNRRLVRIKKVIFSSRHRVGETEVVAFSVESETAFYEVEFNKQTCQWTLKNTHLVIIE